MLVLGSEAKLNADGLLSCFGEFSGRKGQMSSGSSASRAMQRWHRYFI